MALSSFLLGGTGVIGYGLSAYSNGETLRFIVISSTLVGRILSSSSVSNLSPNDLRGLASGFALGPPPHSFPPKIYLGDQSIFRAILDSDKGISPYNIY